jgi:hypothetical protein
MHKAQLTHEAIMEKNKTKNKIVLVAAIFIAFMFLAALNTAGKEGILFISLFLAIIVWVVIGQFKANKNIKNGDYEICLDKVVDKTRKRTRKGKDKNYLHFANTGSHGVNWRDYDAVGIGDMCYIIIIQTGKNSHTHLVFPESQYELSEELKYKLTVC